MDKLMNIHFTTKALAVLLIVGNVSIASAQGFATWLGDRVGLGNVGRALDDANREAKRAVPVYGQTEEAVTRAGRHILTESVVESTAPLIKYPDNWDAISKRDEKVAEYASERVDRSRYLESDENAVALQPAAS